MNFFVLQVAEKSVAAHLLAIIGVTNTIGRVAIGMISDLPKVNSLFLNNILTYNNILKHTCTLYVHP